MNRRCTADLLVRGAREVLTVAGPAPRTGSDAGDCRPLAHADIAVRNGRIVWIGPERELPEQVDLEPGAEILDAGGGLVTPGLVDAHTHPIFAGFREDEFNRMIAGESYADIVTSGGGIRRTMRDTRAASDATLEALGMARLDRMLLHGTTTAEAKSGYGLTLEHEIRSLEALRRLGERHPVRLSATLLAAHTVPPEYADRRLAYVELVTREIIPAARGLARYCDVFCDPSAFTPEESRRVLLAGRAAGLLPRIHADEFAASGGAELAAEIGAITADHLGGMNEEAIPLLAAAGTTAVLLPGTLFFLGERRYAPARKLIAGGVPVALGTDLNPGTSHTESMTAIVTLACLMMRMTIDEAIVAATLNSAYSLGLAGECGSLEVGKRADLVVFDVPNRFHLVYHYGLNHVRHVVAAGRTVVRDRQICRPGAAGAVL